MTDVLDRALEDAVARLVDAAFRHNLRLAKSRKIAATDLRAVRVIDRAGELRPSQLARALGISESGISSVISRLVDAGLVQRARGPRANEVCIRPVPAATADLGLAPDKQVVAVCDHLDLDPRERETIVAFAEQAADLIDREAGAIRPAAQGIVVPSPPRWS